MNIKRTNSWEIEVINSDFIWMDKIDFTQEKVVHLSNLMKDFLWKYSISTKK